jgi:crotonobetainyl-CoA:carnitine CoA-transferase CaiB-like acyl-CoA transferase
MTMNETRSENLLPLSGIRILELGHTVMGPSCTMVLADLGADVIKVEPPEGDRTRGNVGFGSALYPVFNRNKRSFSVDLKSDAGKALLMKLVTRSDALVENFAHGTMERLGLGYETLSKVNPGIVFCSLKGFLSGPYEERPALDEVVQFMGGLAYMTGPTGRPLRAGASVVDIMGGMFGALGIMAALRERERTGRGQLVKSALFESTAFLVAQHMGQQALTGKAPPPMPEKEGSWAVYQQRERIRPIVTEKFGALAYDVLVEKLERLKIPFGPLAKPGDLFDDPHLNTAGRMLEIVLPTGKTAKIPGIPLEMSGHTPGIRMQPPKMGEHTREILLELGYDEADADELIAKGVAIGLQQ